MVFLNILIYKTSGKVVFTLSDRATTCAKCLLDKQILLKQYCKRFPSYEYSGDNNTYILPSGDNYPGYQTSVLDTCCQEVWHTNHCSYCVATILVEQPKSKEYVGPKVNHLTMHIQNAL